MMGGSNKMMHVLISNWDFTLCCMSICNFFRLVGSVGHKWRPRDWSPYAWVMHFTKGEWYVVLFLICEISREGRTTLWSLLLQSPHLMINNRMTRCSILSFGYGFTTKLRLIIVTRPMGNAAGGSHLPMPYYRWGTVCALSYMIEPWI